LTYESQQISARGGARLVAYRWPTRAAPRAALVIVHGMAEHARRYARLAQTLAQHDIEVHGFDLRGHGATTRSTDHGFLGDDITWDVLIDDVQRVYRRARESSGSPVFLLGHSLGSFLAMSVLQRHGRDYAGAILSGTDLPSWLQCRAGAMLARLEIARMDTSGASDLLQRLTIGAYDRRLARRFGPMRSNAWLSSDDAAVDAYESDPDCGFALRAGAWHTILNGIAAGSSAHARRKVPVELPLFMLAGSDDPVGRFGRGPERLARALESDGQRDLELRVYEGRRHELLHDYAADRVAFDIHTWIASRCPTSQPLGRDSGVAAA